MSYPNPMSIFENRDGSGQNPTGSERNPTQPDPSKIKNPKTQPNLAHLTQAKSKNPKPNLTHPYT